MSHSDIQTPATADLSDHAGKLEELVGAVLQNGKAAELDERTIRSLVTSAVRLYAGHAEATDRASNPLHDDVSATEAVELACALLKARDLNPFDLALWFSRTR